MKNWFKIFSIAFIGVILMSSCRTTAVGSVSNNVCKTLHKKTVLYAVFVDSDGTHPWSEYDIKSTLDSITVAVDWIKKEASKNGITIEIEIEHASKGNVIPFKEAFRYETLSGTLYKFRDLKKGIALVDKWSDNVSKDVARTLPGDTSEIILTKNRSNNRERMIAKLRNKYETDNIAVLFFINNYFENEISVAMHTESGTETEYAIVSTKAPPVIAHEFLHLFGAWDLYISPFDRSIFKRMKKRRAMRKYPKEIMAFAHKRHIDSLEISPLTKYLIGWDSSLDKKHSKTIVGRRWKLLEY